MNNIDIGDTVQLNPKGLTDNLCVIIWGHHNNTDIGLGTVTHINTNQAGVASATVRLNNGVGNTIIPITCLREHYSAGGGKTKRKKSTKKYKRKKSKRKKYKRNKSKKRSKKK
jgi:hypothetical protein